MKKFNTISNMVNGNIDTYKVGQDGVTKILSVSPNVFDIYKDHNDESSIVIRVFNPIIATRIEQKIDY